MQTLRTHFVYSRMAVRSTIPTRNLEWVGHFLEEVDLASFGQSDISAEFAVSAQKPAIFYEALANIDDLLRSAGIQDEPELHSFLTDTFKF